MASIQVEGHHVLATIIKLMKSKKPCDAFRATDLKSFLLRRDVTDSYLPHMRIVNLAQLTGVYHQFHYCISRLLAPWSKLPSAR